MCVVVPYRRHSHCNLTEGDQICRVSSACKAVLGMVILSQSNVLEMLLAIDECPHGKT